MKTKFGSVTIHPQGYYKIRSRKEGNRDKLLHRLMWEDFYGCEVPEGFVVHHKDGDKLNNCILNLQLMRKSEHDKLHNCGSAHELSHCKNASKAMNTIGYFRVSKKPDPTCKQGFMFQYQYYEGKRRRNISSVSLERLKNKVLAKGLEWEEFEVEN